MKLHKTIEIGHIFKLGYKYSQTMGLRVTGSSGEEDHSHHGFIRDRHRAHSHLVDRAES